MNNSTKNKIRFEPGSVVVASFGRGAHDNFALVMDRNGLLAFYALATRRGAQGVSHERTRLNPFLGLLNFMAAKSLPLFQAETFRFRLYPIFDRWVRSQLRPGQHFITSYAFANASMRWVRGHGGKTFLDAGNSHPALFWELLSEEQRKWESPYPPVAPFYNKRCLETVDATDYIFAQSTFVRDSFLQRGWAPDRAFLHTLPQNLDWFKPPQGQRPESRPLTLLNTGALCLRKGTPDLLEAFRLIRQKEPQAVLRLSRTVRDDARQVLRRYEDLPIDWSPHFDLSFEDQRKSYVERFQTSDLFVFPSIEDGFAIVVAEALACGVPVITTRNTGASDLILPGENGDVVPIRDPLAIADAVLSWWPKIRAGKRLDNVQSIRAALRFEAFEKTVMGHLASLGKLPAGNQ